MGDALRTLSECFLDLLETLGELAQRHTISETTFSVFLGIWGLSSFMYSSQAKSTRELRIEEALSYNPITGIIRQKIPSGSYSELQQHPEESSYYISSGRIWLPLKKKKKERK